jgi:hypothetical protein
MPAVGAHQFFVGLLAGLAMFALPVVLIGFGGSILDAPARLGAWIDEPGRRAEVQVAGAATASRPVQGYVPGVPTAVPTAAPPPTLQPARVPAVTNRPPAALSVRREGAPGNVWMQAMVGADGQPVPLRRAIGVTSAGDPMLAPGSIVLLSPVGVVRLHGQEWRSVRTPEGAIGWLPSDVLALVDAPAAGPPSTAPAPEPERLKVANTDGQGVVFRASPRMEDRTAAGLREGTVVGVLERSGADWVRVRADNGQEGWIPSRYLAPAG